MMALSKIIMVPASIASSRMRAHTRSCAGTRIRHHGVLEGFGCGGAAVWGCGVHGAASEVVWPEKTA